MFLNPYWTSLKFLNPVIVSKKNWKINVAKAVENLKPVFVCNNVSWKSTKSPPPKKLLNVLEFHLMFFVSTVGVTHVRLSYHRPPTSVYLSSRPSACRRRPTRRPARRPPCCSRSRRAGPDVRRPPRPSGCLPPRWPPPGSRSRRTRSYKAATAVTTRHNHTHTAALRIATSPDGKLVQDLNRIHTEPVLRLAVGNIWQIYAIQVQLVGTSRWQIVCLNMSYIEEDKYCSHPLPFIRDTINYVNII